MAYTTINKGSSYFNTVLYTGTQTQQTINVGFQPDFVWIKSRSNVQVNALFDAVRGVSIGALQSNATAAENANQKLVAYTSTGFTLPSVNYEWTNTTGWTFASWNWLGANTTVSNTAGSITSTVSANPTAGFSVVSYTGAQGSNFTIGHGLSVTPNIVFAKSRNTVANWGVYYRNNGVNTNYMSLNSTGAQGTNNGSLAGGAYMVMNSTTLQIDFAAFANAGSSMIAYCFAEIKGYSKFGSYTGNGSTDGPFVYTGFKPAFFIVKCSNTTFNWVVEDNKRNTFNVVDKYLLPNTSDAEGTLTLVDFLSNGIKIRTTDNSHNGSGNTYIYMAFAENPFVSSTQIPTTAR
jgi:hypothetical protein